MGIGGVFYLDKKKVKFDFEMKERVKFLKEDVDRNGPEQSKSAS